jgi:hypothetical protein
MQPLTVDLATSAELLGTEPDAFLEFVTQKSIRGIIKIHNHWRVSIFTLAQLLNTTPALLMTMLEDDMLGHMLEEDAGEEGLAREEAMRVYQSYVAGSEVSCGP